MPNIKLRDGSGVETTYNNVDTITAPLADGTGTYLFGLTDDELTFSGNQEYVFYKDHYLWLFEKYKERLRFNDITNIASGFFRFTGDLSGIVINTATDDRGRGAYVSGLLDYFGGEHLPTIQGSIQCNKMLNNSFEINNPLTDTELTRFLCSPTAYTFQPHGDSGAGNFSSVQMVPFRNGSSNTSTAPKIRNLNNAFKYIEEHLVDDGTYTGGIVPAYDIYNLSALDEMKNIPVGLNITWKQNAYGSSIFGSQCFSYFNHCKDIMFYTGTNGEVATWPFSGISLSLVSPIGYGSFALDPDETWYLVNDDASYNLYKNENNYYSYGSTTKSYAAKAGNKNVQVGLGYSRYNHDSAVRTINTLPDTSTRTGGANTITFKAYMGCFTDGGAIETLTPEEIAVATAKGWTVAFNNTTS